MGGGQTSRALDVTLRQACKPGVMGGGGVIRALSVTPHSLLRKEARWQTDGVGEKVTDESNKDRLAGVVMEGKMRHGY